MSKIFYHNTNKFDALTRDSVVILQSHHEIHDGKSFYVMYSVASLGDMGSPDDMITLTWTTANTTELAHFQFIGIGSAGWRLRLIEAPSGGGADPTGSLTILNKKRNSSNTSGFIDLASAANKVSYDATLATGGTTLWDQYFEGSGGPLSGGTAGGERDEMPLKENTKYQLSLYGTDANPATLYMKWYEEEGAT